MQHLRGTRAANVDTQIPDDKPKVGRKKQRIFPENPNVVSWNTNTKHAQDLHRPRSGCEPSEVTGCKKDNQGPPANQSLTFDQMRRIVLLQKQPQNGVSSSEAHLLKKHKLEKYVDYLKGENIAGTRCEEGMQFGSIGGVAANASSPPRAMTQQQALLMKSLREQRGKLSSNNIRVKSYQISDSEDRKKGPKQTKKKNASIKS